jgi:hypothetical protein
MIEAIQTSPKQSFRDLYQIANEKNWLFNVRVTLKDANKEPKECQQSDNKAPTMATKRE